MPTYPDAETQATALFNALDMNFTLPVPDLTGVNYNLPTRTGNPIYAAVDPIVIADLTTGDVNGTGVFDKLMMSMKTHLLEQFTKNRITGDQFTKAYIELTTACLTTGLQFIMGKDAANWQVLALKEQAKRAEAEAVTAAVNLETAKAQLATARYQAELIDAQFCLVKMQLATEEARQQLTWAQKELTDEQYETARGATRDTLSTGGAIAGMTRRQRELLEQQKLSYIRSDDARVAKLYLDTWVTRKTTDDVVALPNEFDTASIDELFAQLRDQAGFTPA